MQFKICELCAQYYNITFAVNRYPGICDTCTFTEKFCIAILVLKRVRQKKNFNFLSKYEQDTLIYSGILDVVHCDDGLVHRLRKRLLKKYI